MALGVPGRLRPRIFSTFGTARVVGCQPNAPAAFTPGEVPGTHFQRLSRPQDTWFCRKEPRKKSQVTTPEIDPGTVRLVAQRLNHYATPGPVSLKYITSFRKWITPIDALWDQDTWPSKYASISISAQIMHEVNTRLITEEGVPKCRPNSHTIPRGQV